MNLLNASLQSVPEREHPERERPAQRNYHINLPANSPGRNAESGIVQNTVHRSKTPPPRPAPPSIASSGNYYNNNNNNKSIRTSESFRHAKSAPMFADEHSEPPVRPIRRKQSKRVAGSSSSSKTDSGTQTIRNEMIRPLDHPSKPIKKYYLGQDPFNGDPLKPSAQSAQSVQSPQSAQSPHSVPSPQSAPYQRSAKFNPGSSIFFIHQFNLI